jgi:hypothetical protein
MGAFSECAKGATGTAGLGDAMTMVQKTPIATPPQAVDSLAAKSAMRVVQESLVCRTESASA